MVLFDVHAVFIKLFVISLNVYMFVYGLGEGSCMKIREIDMC